jgi:hypothetical protein
MVLADRVTRGLGVDVLVSEGGAIPGGPSGRAPALVQRHP